MSLELQDLKIPAGWLVSHNEFYDVHPTKENVDSADTVFIQDILQFTNEYRNRVLDLGWYPEGEFEKGAFGLVVYEGDFNGKLLYELKSKSKDDIVSEINRLLALIAYGRM